MVIHDICSDPCRRIDTFYANLFDKLPKPVIEAGILLSGP
jgi:hypothetical protein